MKYKKRKNPYLLLYDRRKHSHFFCLAKYRFASILLNKFPGSDQCSVPCGRMIRHHCWGANARLSKIGKFCSRIFV